MLADVVGLGRAVGQRDRLVEAGPGLALSAELYFSEGLRP